jgi:membrane protein DedA with SNARE-associated domain/membrane-associated phospholipid phosphatase
MTGGQTFAALAAVAIALFAISRRRRLGTPLLIAAAVVVVVLGVLAAGVVHIPKLETLIRHLAHALGKWTYALVGAMAFLETGAFVGFIAPGEFTVILGGVIAGEGEISILPLIGLVWICAVSGDSLSFLIGRRVGRQFMLKYGPRIRIDEHRFKQVEDYFDRHGGKTIVIGRFIGFVRPLAPFIAGTSRLPYMRFLPYSVLGTGLWGTTFCLLGYFFWRSFDKVSNIAGKAALGIGVAAAIVVAIVLVNRRLRDPEQRARVEAWLRKRPLLWRVWRFALRPLARFTWPQIRFVWERLTPGNLGIEFTSALAVAAGAAYVFIYFADYFHGHPLRVAAGDRMAFTAADHLQSSTLTDVVKVVTDIGALPVTGALTGLAALMLAMRRHPLELGALVGGFLLVILGVHLAKAGVERPRPSDPLVNTVGSSYPSGHSAYSAVYVAMAVVASRVLGGLVSRAALVLAAALVMALVGATRIYLRAHYLSDVLGGFGLGLGTMALCSAVALVIGHIGHIRNNGRTSPPPS